LKISRYGGFKIPTSRKRIERPPLKFVPKKHIRPLLAAFLPLMQSEDNERLGRIDR
jgi:hypothetical protein